MKSVEGVGGMLFRKGFDSLRLRNAISCFPKAKFILFMKVHTTASYGLTGL